MSIYNLVNKYAMIEALHNAASNRDWQPSAVEEFAKEWGDQFDASSRCHRSTGQSIEAFVADYEKQRPHVLVHQATDMDDMALRLTAFMGDNGVRKATDLGPLMKSLGGDMEALKAAARDFGITDPLDMKQRGVAPGNMSQLIDAKKASDEADALEARAAALRKAADLVKPKGSAADHTTNPWSAQGWNMTKQSTLTRAIGPEKAAHVAAAVGCVLGSTKPNPAYNK